MTPPPTSIDGTEITGATIDGQDVREITVDGEAVFIAATLPVAFSEMIAWYPMESNIFGGDEYSDATALFSGAADTTAYDLIDNGAVFGASEGVTDINEGATSGAFENVSGGQFLTSNVPISLPITLMFWYFREAERNPFGSFDNNNFNFFWDAGSPSWEFNNGNSFNLGSVTLNQWSHVALSIDGAGNATGVFNRNTTASSTVNNIGGQIQILNVGDGRSTNDMRGYMDDVRFYNTDLSLSQIQNIFDNTSPT